MDERPGRAMNVRRGFFRRHLVISISGLFFLGILTYSAITIYTARRETPAVVRRALASKKMLLRLSDLTPRQREILLLVEDPAFYRHKGVDLRTPGAGLTTITQSLVKILYFEHFKPGLAKIRQTLIARFALDPLVDKETQLEIFINHIYLGDKGGAPVYGFADAARQYFDRPFASLTEEEYLAIIAMNIAPVSYNVASAPELNADRVARLKLLIAGDYKPKSLMDQYFGGRYPEGGRRPFLKRLVWGY